MKELKNLKRVAFEEAEKLDAELANKSEFSEKQAEMYKCIMSGLKDQLAVEGMMGIGEYEPNPEEEPEGLSGRRMRNPDTGRYMSGRDRMYYDGYSGHYPMPYPPYNGGWPR